MDRRSRPFAAVAVPVVVVALVLAGCGDDTDGGDEARTTGAEPGATAAGGVPDCVNVEDPVIDPGDGGVYEPDLDPARFVERIDNPYLPYLPGSRWVYEGESEGEAIHIEVAVTDQDKQVMGIDATVVRETESVDGELVEDTFDWYAQDADGNVWYLGEETREYENGEVVSTEGAWEGGVDGALPGIIMLADPQPGEAYRQEWYPCEALDLAEVARVGESVTVAAGAFDDVVVITEWNPLEPEAVEEKSYAPGVGVVLEEQVEGGDERVELVEFTPGA